MAEVKFTEKELGFINECTIDKKGAIVEMPANPFPSLYRKGVIEKGKDGSLMVPKEFRDMFYLDSQVVRVTVKPAGTMVEHVAEVRGWQDYVEPEPEPESEPVPCPEPKKQQAKPRKKAEREPAKPIVKFKYGETGDVLMPDGVPEEYAAFRQLAAAGLNDHRTKGIDEFVLIEKVAEVKEIAREARAENGSEGDREERTDKGSRKRWRYDLAEAVAAYFGVKCARDGREIVFRGDLYMAGAAELAFEYLYIIGNRRAQRFYDDRLADGEPTVGVYNEKAEEFMGAVRERLQPEPMKVEVDGEVAGEYTDEYLDEA